MIAIRRIQVGEANLFRRMRLTSLQDAPYAFSSTYESALRRSVESWREQADNSAQGSDRATFMAFSDGEPIGIAALYRLSDQPDKGEVLQVWVAPAHRGTEVARKLMDAVFLWARNNGFRAIVAQIAKENDRALGFYRKYGFSPTTEVSTAGSDRTTLVREVESDNRIKAKPQTE